jgi:predicted DsbA family dithiol-disulfide isomerase
MAPPKSPGWRSKRIDNGAAPDPATQSTQRRRGARKRATVKIDFVSDVTCPWCAIGLAGLEQAIARLGDEIEVELHLQPFELNPDMPPDGEDLAHYAARKYGSTAEQVAARQSLIRQRAAAAGLQFGERKRVFNTFDAHRLLHWAGKTAGPRRQLALKRALLAAYHARGENPGSHEVLLQTAAEAGLDVAQAQAVLQSKAGADEVRASVRRWQALGIASVPSVIVDDRHLIQGGRPVEVFEQALREIAAQPAAA